MYITPPEAHDSPTAEAPRDRQPFLHNLVAAVAAPGLCLSGHDGQIRRGGVEGLYVQDVRAISHLIVRADGQEPCALGHVVGGATNRFDAALLDIGDSSSDPTVLLSRGREVRGDGMTERLTFRSFTRVPLSFRLEVDLGCDLAPIAAVKSGARPPARPARIVAPGLSWEGPDGLSVRATATPVPEVRNGTTGLLAWPIVLGPGESLTVAIDVAMSEEDPPSAVVMAPPPDTTILVAPRVRARDDRLRRFVEHSVADLEGLRMVMRTRPGDAFLGAGAPWFLTLFGRDSLWAARMLLPLGTELAAGTLSGLAALQGTKDDPETGEEPGKILHELRRDPNWHALWPSGGGRLTLPPTYYGTVDATPLWVCLLRDAWRWGMAEDQVAGHLDAMERCLIWMADFGASEEGFLSYIGYSGRGLANQGWKDSHDAIQYRDGRIAAAPLALCEVQGYAYEAAMGGADLLEAFGRSGAERWRSFAAELAGRFRERFWLEDELGPYPAIALDGTGTPVDAISSNMGHLLGTGLLSDEESAQVGIRLGDPDLDCGYGLRTLAASSKGFNPVSYHCGSIWPHDTAIAISGLARTPGDTAKSVAMSLIDGLVKAAEFFDYRMPELFGVPTGGAETSPVPYPAACRPQAWSAASSVVILAALLGIDPDLPSGQLRIEPLPGAPAPLDVAGLFLGTSPLRVEIDGNGTAVLIDPPSGVRVRSGA